MAAPRFDSPALLVLNLLSILVFVVVVSLWVWSRRRGRESKARDLLILVNFAFAGWYVPVFPLIWFMMEWEDNQMLDGTVKLPFD